MKSYGKQKKYEERHEREQRQQAMADDIVELFECHTVSAKAALEVLGKAKEKVLEMQDKLDYAYQHQSPLYHS